MPNDHFEELAKGTLESVASKGPVEEGAETELKLGEVGLYDVNAGVGKLDGLTVVVGSAAGLVGKKAKVRIERVLDGVAYATLLGGAAKPDQPITAEGEAEKPTRKPPAKKGRTPDPDDSGAESEAEVEAEVEVVEPEPEAETEPEAEAEAESETETGAETAAKPKKKTRRGSRGGKRRRKPAGSATATAATNGEVPKEQTAEAKAEPAPRIHLPDRELGSEEPEEEAAVPVQAENGQDGAEQPKPKKKTRRGSRGGRRRRKPAASSPKPPAE